MSFSANYKLSGLVLEPTLSAKIRLKEALSALPRFSGVMPMNSIRETTEFLKTAPQSYDIIFISQAIAKEEAASFIKIAKDLGASQDAAFVLLLKSSKDADMAGAMLIGFDGMLAEPYSVDSLNDICELALKVKHERGTAREQAILGLMMTEVSKQLDNVAILKSCGYDSTRGMDKLREACVSFKHLSQEAAKAYEDIAEKIFGAAMPAKVPEKKYSGVSKRIKSKQVSKIVDEKEAIS